MEIYPMKKGRTAVRPYDEHIIRNDPAQRDKSPALGQRHGESRLSLTPTGGIMLNDLITRGIAEAIDSALSETEK